MLFGVSILAFHYVCMYVKEKVFGEGDLLVVSFDYKKATDIYICIYMYV